MITARLLWKLLTLLSSYIKLELFHFVFRQKKLLVRATIVNGHGRTILGKISAS